jgi:hypothetical protein
MGVANKYNRQINRFTAELPEDLPFKKLSDLGETNTPLIILSMWINTKGKYGDHPVVATSSELVDFPNSMTEAVKEMIKDDDVIEAVNNRKLGFTVRKYHTNKYNRDAYTADFVDLE